MLDNCTLRFYGAEWETLGNNFCIHWLRQELVSTKRTTRYTGKLPSPVNSKAWLYIQYEPVAKVLTIKKSLHKWYKGSNVDRYTLSDLCDTIDLLSVTLGIDLWKARVANLEFGVNLYTKEVPIKYLNTMLQHGGQGKRLYDTSFLGHCINRSTEYYYFKVYDKTKEANIPINVVRIEVRRNDGKRYLPELQTVEQIVSEEGFIVLAKELIEKFKLIPFDYETLVAEKKLTPNQHLLYMLMNRCTPGRIRSELEQADYTTRSVSRIMRNIADLRKRCKIIPNSKRGYLTELLNNEVRLVMT